MGSGEGTAHTGQRQLATAHTPRNTELQAAWLVPSVSYGATVKEVLPSRRHAQLLS